MVALFTPTCTSKDLLLFTAIPGLDFHDNYEPMMVLKMVLIDLQALMVHR